MKKVYTLLAFILLGLSGCSSDEDSRGFDGNDGRDGIDGVNGAESYVFEYQFSFTAPDYGVILNLPSDFIMLDSDVMLMYFLWEVTDDGMETWRSLSQTLYFTDGLLTYNYDFTKYDANVFLDGTVNLNGLGVDHTDNWVARVVVVPGQFSGRIDYSDYEAVKAYFDLSPSKLGSKDYPKKPM